MSELKERLFSRPHGKAMARFLEIEREHHAWTQELATLAARICPELCQKNPSRAIEIAQALLDEARRKIDKAGGGKVNFKAFVEAVIEKMEMEGTVVEEDEKKAFRSVPFDGRKVFEYFNAKFGSSFEPGVKFITGENRLDRAMPWFRKFIGSRTPNEQACNTEIAKARKDGFTGIQLSKFQAAFGGWKTKEKSRIARTKSAKRKKKDRL
jgi:hypothetical protein